MMQGAVISQTTMDLFAPSHLLILLVIVLLIFGPSKLGDVGGALGKAIRDFKKAMNEPEEGARTEPKSLEKPRSPENGATGLGQPTDETKLAKTEPKSGEAGKPF